MSSIIIYGSPGTGKTTLMASFTKLGYRVHFLDLDRKIQTMKNLQEFVEAGTVTYKRLENPLEKVKMSQVAMRGTKSKPLTIPQGYVEFTKMIDELEDNPPEDAEITIPVIDSMSKVNSHLKHYLRYHAGGKLGFDGWDAILSNYEILFNKFFNLQPDIYPHCAMICHSRDDRDEVLQITESRLMIDGQFRDKAGGEVEEVWFTYVDAPTRTASAKFRVLTKPTGWVKHARSSRNLPTSVDADATILFEDEYAKTKAKARK